MSKFRYKATENYVYGCSDLRALFGSDGTGRAEGESQEAFALRKQDEAYLKWTAFETHPHSRYPRSDG